MTTFAMQGTTELARAFLAWPEGDGPHPAVLVLHEIMGLNDDIERITNRFADEGYVALAPDAARSDARAVATFYGDVPKRAEALEGIPPCFGGYGGKDRIFGPLAYRLRNHLEELDVVSDVVSYPDVGHSFMNHNHGAIAKIGAIGPMNVGHDAAAAEDSWERMLAFFETNLSAT